MPLSTFRRQCSKRLFNGGVFIMENNVGIFQSDYFFSSLAINIMESFLENAKEISLFQKL